MPLLSEWVPPVYWLITIIDCTASSDTSRLIWFVFSFLLSPHLCSLQASRHKWQLHPFSFYFFLLFKIVAIAHPFQTSQNPPVIAAVYELLSKLGAIYHMMDHWAWYCLLGILDKLLPDRLFYSIGWPHIQFFFRLLHPVFFLLNFVMLLKWWSSIRILSQFLW
jgi:hypothetical protein